MPEIEGKLKEEVDGRVGKPAPLKMRDDSVQWQLEVDKKDIAYLVGVFESYDDFAIVRTVDPSRGRVELLISPDYLEEVRRLLASLSKEMPIRILDR